MKKIFNFINKLFIMILFFILFSLPVARVGAIAVSGEIGYVERTEDGIKINGATFRVTGTNDSQDLSFGVKYHNDAIMVSTTLQERMTEYALGGSTYGTVPFVMNQEYSGSAFVLEIPVDTGVEIIPWQVVNKGVWQLATVKTIAEDFEAHYPDYKVLAAINGSFFDINASSNYSHTSSGAIAAFGENYKLTANGDQIGFTNDGSTQSIVEQSTKDKSSTPFLTIYDSEGNVLNTYTVNNTNEEPGEGEISVYYGLYDEQHKCTSIDVTSAFIVADSDAYTVAYSESCFYGKGKITKVGDTSLTTNQFAIKSNNEEVTKALKEGVTIRVQYESSNLTNSCDNTIYYVDKLVDNGQSQDSVKDAGVLSGYSQYRYPRTLLGRKSDGTIVMTCTDGRQASKGLYGLNGTESAAEMMYYGCEEAWCFDGGGSTSMCILQNGELTYVNSPSDGSQRADGNAMLVVVKVPKIEVSSSATQSSISLNVNVTEAIEKYSDIYVKMNEEMKQVKEGKTIAFDNLETYQSYTYTLYAKVGESYIDLPYAGTITTAKHDFILSYLSIKLDGDNYKISYEIEDVDNSISTIVMLINGKRFTARNGVITVSKDNGGPLTQDSKLVIAYDLKDLGDKKHVQTVELAPSSKVEEASIVFDSIGSEVDCMLQNLFE